MSNDKVVPLCTATALDLQPDKVLQGAIEACLTDVVIMGYLPDGREYFASSNADDAEVLWLARRLEFRLMVNAEEAPEPEPEPESDGVVLEFTKPE